jgi:hypothetical protein
VNYCATDWNRFFDSQEESRASPPTSLVSERFLMMDKSQFCYSRTELACHLISSRLSHSRHSSKLVAGDGCID